MISTDLGAVTAYAYAVDGGYTGTESQFEADMATLATYSSDIEMYRGTATASNYSNLLSHIVTVGTHYVASNQTFNDRPTEIDSGTGMMVTVSKFYSTIVKQTITSGFGQARSRLVNISDFSPIVSGINADSNGWFVENESVVFHGNALGATFSNLLSHIKVPGYYYVSSAQTFNDRPVDLESGIGAVLYVSAFASTIVKQELFDAYGNIRTRLITKSTYAPVTSGISVDENGWFQTNGLRWEEKNIVCFGDSRTWYDKQAYTSNTKPELVGKTCVGYQEQIRKLTGAKTVNEGVSGDTSIQICNRIRAYNFSNAAAVLLEGGVNDFIRSGEVTIGELAPIGSSFNTNTVYGAWQSAIEYIMTNYPKVKIFVTVPAIAWDGNTVFPYEMAAIKKEVADLYCLPVLDLYKTAGITTINRDTFYCDNVSSTGWRLHFNDDGNYLIGQMIAKYIETH